MGEKNMVQIIWYMLFSVYLHTDWKSRRVQVDFFFLYYNINLVFMSGKHTYLYCVVIIIKKKTLESAICASVVMGRLWTNRSKWMNSTDKRFHPNIPILVRSINVSIVLRQYSNNIYFIRWYCSWSITDRWPLVITHQRVQYSLWQERMINA